MEKSIYEQIFDISDANMKASGENFSHKKSAFLAYTELDPHKVDLIELFNTSAPNQEFLDIAYITLLNRPAEPEAFQNWKKYFSMPEKQFRSLVIRRIVNSREADVCHKRIYNDIFSKQKYTESKSVLNSKAVQKLMPVYRKMPDKMKSLIKKVAGGKKA